MALSIAYWATYVNGQNKLTKKSEAAVESDRVLKFVFDREYRVINSSVQASMRDTSYKVQVSALHMYKKASKTDIKCSWIKHPKSAPPKRTVTMQELLTASLKKRLLSAYNLEKRDPIQWGITHESVALTEYCKEGDVSVLPTAEVRDSSGPGKDTQV
uniref:Uncharacterized protein n=1 Tax=Magallana gigas TaxID=29159 RepID=K1S0V7_MAGGI